MRLVAGLEGLRFYNMELDRPQRVLPCKVSCARCGALIADEGRKMWLAFPTLFDFGTPPQVPDAFRPSCHIFYRMRVMEIEAEGLDTTCPGEIELTATEGVSCGTETLVFNADGTLAQVKTTDEAGNPFDYRTEGTWTAGDTILTLFYRREGTDENNLQPIEPSQALNALWGIDGNTLTIWVPTLSPPLTKATATLEKR